MTGQEGAFSHTEEGPSNTDSSLTEGGEAGSLRVLGLFLQVSLLSDLRLPKPRGEASPSAIPEVLFFTSRPPPCTLCQGAAPQSSSPPALHSLLTEAVTSHPTEMRTMGRGPRPAQRASLPTPPLSPASTEGPTLLPPQGHATPKAQSPSPSDSTRTFFPCPLPLTVFTFSHLHSFHKYLLSQHSAEALSIPWPVNRLQVPPTYTLREGMNELTNKGVNLRVNGCALIHFLRIY